MEVEEEWAGLQQGDGVVGSRQVEMPFEVLEESL